LHYHIQRLNVTQVLSTNVCVFHSKIPSSTKKSATSRKKTHSNTQKHATRKTHHPQVHGISIVELVWYFSSVLRYSNLAEREIHHADYKLVDITTISSFGTSKVAERKESFHRSISSAMQRKLSNRDVFMTVFTCCCIEPMDCMHESIQQGEIGFFFLRDKKPPLDFLSNRFNNRVFNIVFVFCCHSLDV
jgi:hypothetical protein